MRQTASCALLGWLALTAGAYINGGDFHDSRDTFANRMKADGWALSIAYEAAGEATGNEGITTLVGQALQALPAEQRGKVTAEEKREGRAASPGSGPDRPAVRQGGDPRGARGPCSTGLGP